MKREITTTETVCDFCGDDSPWNECLGCGKDICRECIAHGGAAAEYRAHLFYSSDNDDGIYCLDCNQTAVDTELHRGYCAIARLRSKYDKFFADFKIDADAAEDLVENLLRAQRAAARD